MVKEGVSRYHRKIGVQEGGEEGGRQRPNR